MRTFLTLLLLCSISLKYVHTLECYVSDYASFRENNLDAHSIVKNCDTYFEELAELANSDLPSTIEDDLRCFTVKIETEITNISLQGCTPEDGCVKIISNLSNLTSSGSISCRECAGNLCNGEDVHVVKNVFHTASNALKKRTYLILTIVMILVFMCVISIMLRIFSKKYERNEKKYSPILV